MVFACGRVPELRHAALRQRSPLLQLRQTPSTIDDGRSGHTSVSVDSPPMSEKELERDSDEPAGRPASSPPSS